MANRISEALAALLDRLDLPRDLAYHPTWSAAPDLLALLVDHAFEERPTVIVECGSGISTVILAACCRRHGHGHVHSLESVGLYAARTRAELARTGLGDHATVLHAPLAPVPAGDGVIHWYAIDALPPGAIDLLLVDGPPGFIQRLSRLPALPRLASRLAPGAAIILDDADRPDERAIAARWREAFPDLDYRHVDLTRGAAIFRRPR